MTAAHTTEQQNDVDDVLLARQLELLAEAASRGCGLSHDLYVSRFSTAVDAVVARLSQDARRRAILLARQWDYATPQERAENAPGEGWCSHGIHYGCGPAGCEEPGADQAAADWNAHSTLGAQTGLDDLNDRDGKDGQGGEISGEGRPGAATDAPIAAAAAVHLAREILLTPVGQLLAAAFGAIAGARQARRGV